MRVISGKYKGRNLLGYEIKGTRPTMDRVKESLFAMIQDKIEGSSCLDLFAGSGNLGIEALSQGANLCVFVDHSKIAVKVIKENITKLNILEQCEVYQSDFLDIIPKLSERKFDIIFLDPPYDTNYIEQSLFLIDKYHLLNDGAYLILESNLEKKVMTDNYCLLKRKKYGDKYVGIYRNDA